MRPWLLVVALAACSHPPESATTPKPLAVSSSACKRAADQVIDLLAMQAQERGQQIGPDLYKQMSDSLVERCEQDKWSADAQQCATGAKTAEDFGKCEDKFTQAQRDALIQSVGGDSRKADKAPDAPGGAAGGGGATTGAAPPAPAAVAPAAAPPPPPPAPTPSNTRGAKQKSKASDPCEGGQ